uniref:Histone deacetylase domain-containing protein n=1 Tax=Trichuris muris TaxID=70415 RepID=A0A5S6Q6W0_TRIMR
MLISVAGNRLVVALEGGYCTESLLWSVSCVIQALLRSPIYDIALELCNHCKCMRAFASILNYTLKKPSERENVKAGSLSNPEHLTSVLRKLEQRNGIRLAPTPRKRTRLQREDEQCSFVG